MTDIIELAFEAGAEFIPTTKQDGFESPEYVETVWAFNQDELTKFAQLLQQGEAVDAEAEKAKAFKDAQVYGLGFMYQGKRLNPADVVMTQTNQSDTQQKLDKAREALHSVLDSGLLDGSYTLHDKIKSEVQQALKDTE